MTDQEIDELRARNEQRLKEVKEKMGERWLLHPANKMTKEKCREVVKHTNRLL